MNLIQTRQVYTFSGLPRSSIADAIVAWEKAIANARANAMDVPGMEAYLAPLEKILTDAKDLTARLDMRNGVKQEETKDRRELMQAGKVQVSRIRSAIRAFFGPSSERLIEFGGRPVRPRSKKVKQVKSQPPAVTPAGVPGTPAPEPAKPAVADTKDTQ
jgi:hypothetical protein